MEVTKTKLYIAGPMTGLSQYNYPAFKEAEKWLKFLGYDVLNPIHSENENLDRDKFKQDKEWYMRRAFRMVTEADGIALLRGWEDSVGVDQELQLAAFLDIPAMPIGMWSSDASNLSISNRV